MTTVTQDAEQTLGGKLSENRLEPDFTRPSNELEQAMQRAIDEDTRATKRLGWIAVLCWSTSMLLLTAGGLIGVLVAERHADEGLLLALVTLSVPAMFCLLGGTVSSVLWSRRTKSLTLKTLQARLARIEEMLRE